MAILIPRIRSINVRLSQAEYVELEQLCVAAGARSLSDLVRGTMHNLVTGASQNGVLALTINQHAAQVRELEQKVETLAAEIALLRANTPPANKTGVNRQNKLPEELLLAAQDGLSSLAAQERNPNKVSSQA
jgi:outer membrane murein-binding lipoprotein Lpp